MKKLTSKNIKKFWYFTSITNTNVQIIHIAIAMFVVYLTIMYKFGNLIKSLNSVPFNFVEGNFLFVYALYVVGKREVWYNI